MKVMTSQPKGPYYMTKAAGGLNGAIQGYPTVINANVLCNCVGFANGRFNQIINDSNLKGINKSFKYQLVCNAENFIESAKKQGLKISKEPVIGGIMVWQKGTTLSGGDGAGHVAVVEKIYSDGSIDTSESGYAAFAFKVIHRTNSNGRWGMASGYTYRGCIINPSIKDNKKEETVKEKQKYGGTLPSKTLKKGSKGDQVKYLQKFLNWYGNYKLAVDGIFGAATDSAVRKFQIEQNLDPDGIVGPLTRNKMKIVKK